MKKPDLVKLLREVKPEYVSYEIDTLFARYGHVVLRLPPYHPEINPIEEVWGALKQTIGYENIEQNVKSTRFLIDKHFNQDQTALWAKTCENVKKYEKKYVEGYGEDFTFAMEETAGEFYEDEATGEQFFNLEMLSEVDSADELAYDSELDEAEDADLGKSSTDTASEADLYESGDLEDIESQLDALEKMSN